MTAPDAAEPRPWHCGDFWLLCNLGAPQRSRSPCAPPERSAALPLEAVELGPSAAAALARSTNARIELALRRAAYASVDGGLVHLAAPGAPLGPLTVRLRRWGRIAKGAAIELDISAARVWTWMPPAPVELSAVAAATAAARAILPSPALDAEVLAAADCRAPGGLAAAAWRLAGVGPGLTPAGDDVLAGLLLAEVLTGSDRAGARRGIAPALRATTPIGRAYLRAAARGECAEPVARVLDAALRGDAEAAARRAPALGDWGATTGPALLAGFDAGVGRHALTGPAGALLR